ncbi:MAG: hypothetical protein IV090_00155 [Candidatus Sericytochromatia bacterium]|nr:hypothetical protein [Candidatus Sericytochromatia bacterium]
MPQPITPLLVWSEILSPQGEAVSGFDWFFSPLSLRDWLEAWFLPAAMEALLVTGHTTRSLAKLLEMSQGHPWQAAAQAAMDQLLALKLVEPLDLKAACLGFADDLNRSFAPTPAPLHLLIFPDLPSAAPVIWEQKLCDQARLGEYPAWLDLCEAAQTQASALLDLRLLLA